MASKPAAGKSPGEKRKRVVLTLKEKMDICARLERGESRRALMQEYNVGMSTLYDIKAHKAQLLRFFANSDSSKALERRRTLHTPKLEHLDRVLYEWFLVKRAEGVPVSGPMLIEKAKDFYEQMHLTEPCVFSGGWLWRFKARHGIKKLDASSEKQVADHQAAEQFCSFFRSLTAEHGLSPEQVYNADETGLFWRCLPNPPPEGGAAPGVKQNKDRLTVLMCANATGSHKIKPLVIGKCSGPRAFKGIQHLPAAYKAQGNVWVDKEIFSDWFHHIFVPSVKEHFRTTGLPEDSKAILLLDHSRAHPQESELVSDNIFTIFLPASVTSLIQPMDQGIRRDFMRNFINPPVTLQSFHPRYNMNDAIFNVACAWNAVPSDIFSRAWRKLWPAVPFVEGSSSEEELERLRTKPRDPTFAHILELGREAPYHPSSRLHRSLAPEHRGPGLEAGEGHAATAGLAPAMGTLEQAEKDSEEAAWEQAALAFDAVVRFAERQPCFTAQEVGQLRALRSVFVRQRQVKRRRLALRAVVKLEAPQECSPLPCSSLVGNH
ncbi:jerky protein homolog [Manis javanica]|uniref:jerky protein homolog n=1 Tax=Manis javanica TaxID=9974 RepID=UPI000813B512|nr:jerky protein homolog [Manis javanica]XP_036859462.1 jerky protein homolog [Manis javanica]XP_036879068.1 jerky protein homolog [Manis javanica]XP_036879069.1 jerky protein homolog [Manis javanica]KAI5929461.1 Jerky protein [Manis javanica]